MNENFFYQRSNIEIDVRNKNKKKKLKQNHIGYYIYKMDDLLINTFKPKPSTGMIKSKPKIAKILVT